MNQMYITGVKIAVLLLSAAFLCGCVQAPIVPNDPYYAPVVTAPVQSSDQLEGSLYQQDQGLSLWNDQRARQVGDILTVVLEENTSSSKSSTTAVGKDSSVGLSAPNVLGSAAALAGFDLQAEINGTREASGDAQANQQNQLSGNVAVTVTQVLPNGALVIRGEKWLSLTQGQEFVRITGLVRPADVRQDNSVSSTKIADARMAYGGTGQFAEAHQVGWLTRFFNSRFWPY